MAFKDINKENVENFIKKYINKVINKQYGGIIPVQIVEFKWFGDNLIIDIFLPEPPDEWGSKEVMKFWDDLTDVREFAKMIDHELNSINFVPVSKKQIGISEGLHDTSWENENGDKITLIDLLNVTENIPVQQVSIDWIKPHLLSWEGDEEEVKKIEKSNLKYPILIFVNDDGDFITIIDGHHRAQKAIRHGMSTIKGKIIPINSLPKNIRKVFSHL